MDGLTENAHEDTCCPSSGDGRLGLDEVEGVKLKKKEREATHIIHWRPVRVPIMLQHPYVSAFVPITKRTNHGKRCWLQCHHSKHVCRKRQNLSQDTKETHKMRTVKPFHKPLNPMSL